MIAEKRHPAVLLVVEDDTDMRSLLCDEFWGEGYQLREATTAKKGWLRLCVRRLTSSSLI